MLHNLRSNKHHTLAPERALTALRSPAKHPQKAFWHSARTRSCSTGALGPHRLPASPGGAHGGGNPNYLGQQPAPPRLRLASDQCRTNLGPLGGHAAFVPGMCSMPPCPRAALQSGPAGAGQRTGAAKISIGPGALAQRLPPVQCHHSCLPPLPRQGCLPASRVEACQAGQEDQQDGRQRSPLPIPGSHPASPQLRPEQVRARCGTRARRPVSCRHASAPPVAASKPLRA